MDDPGSVETTSSIVAIRTAVRRRLHLKRTTPRKVRLSDPALDRSVFSERVREYVPFPLGLAGLLVGFAIRDFKLELHSRFRVRGALLWLAEQRAPD